MKAIAKVKLTENGYKLLYIGGVVSGRLGPHSRDSEVQEWLEIDGNEIEAYKTEAELLQEIEDAKPKVVTMRQARLALLQQVRASHEACGKRAFLWGGFACS